MPSRSLQNWISSASDSLDELEIAHRAIGGGGPGRRYATQQINQAYAVLLSSQFQRFCRDLHSEASDYLTAPVASPHLRDILRAQLMENRKLDTGNPNPHNLGTDFGRFDMQFWPAVLAMDQRNQDRRNQLQMLNKWRNAIAHQDFDPVHLGGRTELRLSDVRRWRAACNALAREFDRAIARQLAIILGNTPW